MKKRKQTHLKKPTRVVDSMIPFVQAGVLPIAKAPTQEECEEVQKLIGPVVFKDEFNK